MASLIVFEGNAANLERLLDFFATLAEFRPIGRASSGNELLDACRTTQWDVAVIDMLAPGHDVMTTLWALRRECPSMPLIAISFDPKPDHIRECLRLGVAGLVAWDNMPDQLVPALRAVLGGEMYLSQAVQQILAGEEPL